MVVAPSGAQPEPDLLPYIETPSLTIGSYTLRAFPVLAGLAIVTEFQIVLHRAPRFGIDRLTASTLAGWAIGLGLVGAHLFDVLAYRPRVLLDDPFELIRLWGGLSSMGGMLGGLLGLLWVMGRRRMSGPERLRFVDCLMFALPFTLAIGRLGCALQHDHLGVTSTHWLAVAFPDGPRFDLGLLEFLYVSALAGVFALLDRRRRPDGFFIGAFFALYGPVRFAMDALRVSEARYFGWTPGQYLSILATLVGLAALAWVSRRGSEASAA
jgi:phosphatidylglycerol---prolipoprotein diacylglyceryl transferase